MNLHEYVMSLRGLKRGLWLITVTLTEASGLKKTGQFEMDWENRLNLWVDGAYFKVPYAVYKVIGQNPKRGSTDFGGNKYSWTGEL